MMLPRPEDVSKSSLLVFISTSWSGPENIVWVQIDGESSWALLDSGSTSNEVTSYFIEVYSLDVGLLNNLTDGILSINGLRGVFS